MTNLIVISGETCLENESSLVNDLFAEGLGLFHLRKPGWDLNTQRLFLEKIHLQNLDKISVHQHRETISEFGLKYFHLKESERASNINAGKNHELKYSTSFHNYNDVCSDKYRHESHHWDYCFLSPVFNSVSKPNYKSHFPADFAIENNLYQKVFALGGITKNNIELVFEKGFYGAAVLGSVWHDSKNAVKNFKELNALCKPNVHTY